MINPLPDSPGRGLFYCDIWGQNYLFGVKLGVKPKTPFSIYNFSVKNVPQNKRKPPYPLWIRRLHLAE